MRAIIFVTADVAVAYHVELREVPSVLAKSSEVLAVFCVMRLSY